MSEKIGFMNPSEAAIAEAYMSADMAATLTIRRQTKPDAELGEQDVIGAIVRAMIMVGSAVQVLETRTAIAILPDGREFRIGYRVGIGPVFLLDNDSPLPDNVIDFRPR